MMSHVTAAMERRWREGVEVKEGLFLTQQQPSVTQLVLFFQAMDQSGRMVSKASPPASTTHSPDKEHPLQP